MKSLLLLVHAIVMPLLVSVADANPYSSSNTNHTPTHEDASNTASNNLINTITGVCKLEDLALGSCKLADFCATLQKEDAEAGDENTYLCDGDYFTEWTVTKVEPEWCHPAGLTLGFSAYSYNASTWDDEEALATGHSCAFRNDTHTFVNDQMISASRTVIFTRPAIQVGRLDYTSPTHVCQPREHLHFTQYARDVAFCMDNCLSYQVNQQPCKEGCRDCGPNNTPYDCSNVDPGLTPSCYSFHDYKQDFLKYFQKVNTGNTDSHYQTGTDADAGSKLRPGVEPCFTEDDPVSCHSNNDRNLFGMPASPVDEAVVTACNDIEVLFLSGIQFDHQLHHKAFEALGTDSSFCPMIREHYSSCYWCAPEILEEKDDQYCATLETFCKETPDVIDESVNATKTCSDVAYWLDYFTIYPNTIDLCYRAEQSLYQGTCDNVCGRDKEALRSPFRPSQRTMSVANSGFNEDSYLGADTDTKKKTLVWLTRSSAILSFLGGCFILYNSLYHRHNRAMVYYQLLAAMAVFDVCTAAAWSLATHPLPPEAGYIYGASGDDTSCKVQGFFVQLGFTSVFYNVSLSAYYVLVIVYGWQEADLRRIRHWLHIIPLVIGIALAFGALPVYAWMEYGCMMPIQDRWSALLFGVIPLGLSIVCITASMFWIYVVVRRTAAASSRWSARGTTTSLESQVFWQALLYAMSFYVTWPILFAVYLWQIDILVENFALSCVIAFVAPLQGFTDFLVYVRPMVAKIMSPYLSRFSKSLRAGLGLSSPPSHINPSTAFFSGDPGNERGNQENVKARQALDGVKNMDPSVAIANRQNEVVVFGESNNSAVAGPVDSTDEDNSNGNHQEHPNDKAANIHDGSSNGDRQENSNNKDAET